MKSFNSFSSAFNWSEKVINEAKEKSLESISRQVYEDSEIYTYEDTKEMYKSGATNSTFKKGTIILKTPYVRLRYYIGGKANAKHPTGVPQWFEATKRQNMSSYIKQYANNFKLSKGV